MTLSHPPVLLVTGAKDTGKTTLVVELIRRLSARGYRVVALKRAATPVGHPAASGTDTDRFARAGAVAVGLTWPGGTYVAACDTAGETLVSGEDVGPAPLADLVRAASAVARAATGTPPGGGRPEGGPGGRPDLLVIAEGFSDTLYPRAHVLPRAGRPGRPATGPVLATWALGRDASARAAALSDEIEKALPLLALWAARLAGGRPPAGQVVAAVLAGGAGRRLGGRDKWLLDVGGRMQKERCLEVLAGIFDSVMVVGRPPAEAGSGEAGRRDVPVPDPRFPGGLLPVSDLVPGAGPLGGLHSALSAAAGRTLFLLAGDMPFLSRALILHLVFRAHRLEGRFDVLMPTWGDRGWVEPLHAVYAPGCLGRLQELAEAGSLSGLRVTEALAGLATFLVPEDELRLFGPPEVTFLNLNTAEDLARAERLARSGPPASGGRSYVELP
ncbi:MAG: molybdopterin-guanine dinucleotide biosynthesis protein MobB [Firmicutes bacterium]|nr:molybdopterin-guanine dinucleotide biosynthesis protein MobB [Bacillota bacterium]